MIHSRNRAAVRDASLTPVGGVEEPRLGRCRSSINRAVVVNSLTREGGRAPLLREILVSVELACSIIKRVGGCPYRTRALTRTRDWLLVVPVLHLGIMIMRRFGRKKGQVLTCHRRENDTCDWLDKKW